jgi:hypothetical protein
VVGLNGGSFSQMLRAGLTSAFTAAAMFAVGSAFPSGTLPNIAGHSIVGCLSAVMGGTGCGAGALAAGIGAASAPFVPQDLVAGTATSAVLGGLASVAGGGKFANGAITAAYGYLFNHFVHRGMDVVNPWDVGNDAHRTFQMWARQRPDIFTEQGNDGMGTYFPGRIDVGNSYSRELWELKPDHITGLLLGIAEIGHYITFSTTLPGTNRPPYRPGGDSIIPGGSVVLPGLYGSYEYNLAAPGVILYNFKPYQDTLNLSFSAYFGLLVATKPKWCTCQ